MQTTIRAAVLIFSALPLVAASTSYAGRELRPVLVESGPLKLSPVTTTILVPVEATPVATSGPVLIGTPVAGPVASPVLVTAPTVVTPAPAPPAIIIYPTNPIIFPTNPISF